MLCESSSLLFGGYSADPFSFLSSMSEQTESSGELSPAQQLQPAADGIPLYAAAAAAALQADDTSSQDSQTPVAGGQTEAETAMEEKAAIAIYSDYYDRIRDDAAWNESGLCYVPLYAPRTSHGSFSSDRMSSEGSVSPSLPSPIGEHLKNKRDSAQFPITAGAPQPFPEPFSDREARDGGWSNNRNRQQGGGGGRGKGGMDKNDYGHNGGVEYGSSSQDSMPHADVFGGSQESLNGGYGGGGGGYGSGEYGRNGGGGGGGGGYGRQHGGRNNGGGGGRFGGGGGGGNRRNNSNYSNGGGYGNNHYGGGGSEYGGNYGGGGYEQQQQSMTFDNWRSEDYSTSSSSTNKYGGPVSHHQQQHQQQHSHYQHYDSSQQQQQQQQSSGPLPAAFSRININDDQKSNLMSNLARLYNQRTY